MHAPFKRILVFNVNWLGDVLFSTAAIRNLRRNFPASYIACVIPSRCYHILKNNPNLDEIIIFDEKDRHRGFKGHLEFIRGLRLRRFDAVFLLHRSFTRALLCYLAGIPQRIGYSTAKRAFLLTKRIRQPKKDSLHRIDYYLNLLERAGLKVEDRYTEFISSDEDAIFVDEFLKKQDIRKDDFVAVINPGGNWLPKRWPKEYWARLADRLILEFKAKVLISGAQGDTQLASEIEREMREKPILACGVFNLKQVAALFKRADLFVTADTGPLHIATAAGSRRIVALFGPTSAQLTGPYPLKNTVILSKDSGCRVPCYVVDCKDNRCMKAITPDDVIEAVKTLIQKSGA